MQKTSSHISKLFFILLLCSSCSFMNDKNVSLPISSNPSGANIYLDGQYYGRTPKVLNLEPSRNYQALITKEGYGSSSLILETWYTVRANRGPDNARCVLDALGSMFVIPAFGFFSVYCRDFKADSYMVNIENSGGYNSTPPSVTSPATVPLSMQPHRNPPMNDYGEYGDTQSR